MLSCVPTAADARSSCALRQMPWRSEATKEAPPAGQLVSNYPATNGAQADGRLLPPDRRVLSPDLRGPGLDRLPGRKYGAMKRRTIRHLAPMSRAG